jgi:rSAM/selenodomain-associated transferase 1
LTAIAIFVKTPGLSAVKTRLAATIGPARAAALYRHCAAAVAEAAREAAVGTVYWATAEPIDRIDERWTDLPLLEQGYGGLGARMHNVLDQLVKRHGSGLLLGADAPQLDAAVLSRAAEWLQRGVPSSVVGPAADGGFWTFGANHVRDLSRWTRVPYSHPDTLQAFRESMGDDSAWLELPTLTDLDTAEDMARVAAELAALPHPLPRQRDLMAQLK